jgi:hypothetical protein
MRDNLILAHIQTELWRAYVITRQRSSARASVPAERRRVRAPVRLLNSVWRRRPGDDAAAAPE